MATLNDVGISKPANTPDCVRLGVTQNLHAARSLYWKHGFAETGRTTPLARDPRVTEHEMELKLR